MKGDAHLRLVVTFCSPRTLRTPPLASVFNHLFVWSMRSKETAIMRTQYTVYFHAPVMQTNVSIIDSRRPALIRVFVVAALHRKDKTARRPAKERKWPESLNWGTDNASAVKPTPGIARWHDSKAHLQEENGLSSHV